MGSKGGGAGSSALDTVESGIVLLFTERAMALASGWSAPDLVLACGAGFAVRFGLRLDGERGRLFDAVSQVLRGIVLKAVLSAAAAPDAGLALAHLLCMFLLLHALNADAVGATAKYVFASQIAEALSGDPAVGIGLCAALQSNMALLASMPRLHECAQLVVVQLVVQWFRRSIPHGMEFPTTVLFMHMITPMLGQPGVGALLSETYTLALYKAAETVQIPGSERWVQAAYAGLLWHTAQDPVTRLVGQFCCIQAGSGLVLDAGAALLRTDPILSAWCILTGLGAVLLLVR